MKLFYTRKQYGVLVDKIAELEHEYKILCDKFHNREYQYLEGYEKYKNECEKLIKQLNDANVDNQDLFGENNVLTIKCSNLEEEIKEQKKQIKELEKKLEESMSDKYLVRKVRGTKPTKQTTKIKSSVKQSNAIKLVKNI